MSFMENANFPPYRLLASNIRSSFFSLPPPSFHGPSPASKMKTGSRKYEKNEGNSDKKFCLIRAVVVVVVVVTKGQERSPLSSSPSLFSQLPSPLFWEKFRPWDDKLLMPADIIIRLFSSTFPNEENSHPELRSGGWKMGQECLHTSFSFSDADAAWHTCRSRNTKHF